MSFVIQGPYPNMRTTLLLPSPATGNTVQQRHSIQTLRTMNGTLYTYRKPKRDRRSYRWAFTTAKRKAREAKEFVKEYAGGLVRVTDHEGTVRIGYITINPWESRGDGHAGGWDDVVPEAVDFSIEFEERV